MVHILAILKILSDDDQTWKQQGIQKQAKSPKQHMTDPINRKNKKFTNDPRAAPWFKTNLTFNNFFTVLAEQKLCFPLSWNFWDTIDVKGNHSTTNWLPLGIIWIILSHNAREALPRMGLFIYPGFEAISKPDPAMAPDGYFQQGQTLGSRYPPYFASIVQNKI